MTNKLNNKQLKHLKQIDGYRCIHKKEPFWINYEDLELHRTDKQVKITQDNFKEVLSGVKIAYYGTDNEDIISQIERD